MVPLFILIWRDLDLLDFSFFVQKIDLIDYNYRLFVLEDFIDVRVWVIDIDFEFMIFVIKLCLLLADIEE